LEYEDSCIIYTGNLIFQLMIELDNKQDTLFEHLLYDSYIFATIGTIIFVGYSLGFY
jgi:hypothetical protein